VKAGLVVGRMQATTTESAYIRRSNCDENFRES
jgi:hypothetical protein